jgi:hypothetical protein
MAMVRFLGFDGVGVRLGGPRSVAATAYHEPAAEERFEEESK